jgi:hypothetical protein
MQSRDEFDFNVGVAALRRLLRCGVSITEAHAVCLFDRSHCSISSDAMEAIQLLASQTEAITGVAIATCCDTIEWELGLSDYVEVRVLPRCESLARLIASQRADIPLDRLFALLQTILISRHSSESFIAFVPPLKEIVRLIPGVQFIAHVIEHVIHGTRQELAVWAQYMTELASVFLTFICAHPEAIAELAVNDLVGVHAILAAIQPAFAKETDFVDVCAASRVIVALVQCGSVSDKETVQLICTATGALLLNSIDSIEENERVARLHCVIQVFASLVAVTGFQMPAELCHRWFEMIEAGFFSTEYLRLLCVIALPRTCITFAQWNRDDLRQRLIANAIPLNEAASCSDLYEDVFYPGEPDIPMPIEQYMDTIEGFVRESNS